jgi:hypothetical protein
MPSWLRRHRRRTGTCPTSWRANCRSSWCGSHCRWNAWVCWTRFAPMSVNQRGIAWVDATGRHRAEMPVHAFGGRGIVSADEIPPRRSRGDLVRGGLGRASAICSMTRLPHSNEDSDGVGSYSRRRRQVVLILSSAPTGCIRWCAAWHSAHSQTRSVHWAYSMRGSPIPCRDRPRCLVPHVQRSAGSRGLCPAWQAPHRTESRTQRPIRPVSRPRRRGRPARPSGASLRRCRLGGAAAAASGPHCT